MSVTPSESNDEFCKNGFLKKLVQRETADLLFFQFRFSSQPHFECASIWGPGPVPPGRGRDVIGDLDAIVPVSIHSTIFSLQLPALTMRCS